MRAGPRMLLTGRLVTSQSLPACSSQVTHLERIKEGGEQESRARHFQEVAGVEEKYVLGSVCFWRPLYWSRFNLFATVALSQSHPSGPQSYATKLISQRSTTTNLPRTIRRSRQRDNFPSARLDPRTVYVKPTAADSPLQGCSTRFHHHSSSCLLSGSGAIGATIWHALLPSRHLTSAEREIIVNPPRRSSEAGLVSVGLEKAVHSDLVPSGSNLLFKHGTLAFDGFVGSADGLQGRFRGINGRFAMAAGLREGSWNVAWDARSARWLHGRHSAWLLFGVCACFSSAAGAPVPLISTTISPALTEAERTFSTGLSETDRGDQVFQASHGKQVYTNYSVTGIPGDGRCLFRAVAHGSSLRCGSGALDENQQRQLADDLRNKVADELVKRRSETEWFIEGDFDVYVNRIRQPHVWGGEPELLMLSHVLKMPITVYMADRNTKGGLIAICEYGQEYGTDNPVRVLYHGFGHYEALQIHSEHIPPSKL